MNTFYRIVGKILQIQNTPVEVTDYFAGFNCENGNASSSVVLTVKYTDELPEPVKRPTMRPVFGIRYAAMSDSESCWRHILTVSPGGKEYLLANEDWSEQLLVMDATYHKSLFEPQPRWAGLIMCGFYLCLVTADTLLLHASVVEFEGRAVLFTGPSGIGKTTQAELWQKHVGAKILNGDKVFLRIMDGKLMAWGSPWSGSSPYRINDCAEVAAIVVLSKASANVVKKLDILSAIGQLSPNVFLPFWEESALVRGMDVLDKIITQVPVFHLNARKDAEVVHLVRKKIFESDTK